jgi:hypothetical protein
MFYWLESFTQCLLPLLPLGHGLKPHILHHFLIFYADLIKWIDVLMGWPDTVSMTCLGQSYGPRAFGPCRTAVRGYL